MNSLRAYFIIPAIVMSSMIAVLAAIQLQHRFDPGWLGALLAGLSLPLAMLYLMTGRKARAGRYLPGSLVLAISGLGISLLGAARSGEIAALACAGLAAAVFVLYLFWYSESGRSPSTVVRLGKRLPEFGLRSLDGEAVSSTRFQGRPTLLLFYRGNWCPLCMAQVRELADRYRDLASLGVRVVLISPQPQSHTAALARRFSVAMEFYHDAGAQAAQALEIFHPRGLPAGMEALGYAADTVLPTLVLVDSSGRVIFFDQADNYRLRPEPDVFIEIARSSLSV